MTRLPALLPVFSTAFAVIYVVCMHFNIAAFAYYPVPGEIRGHVIANAGADVGPPIFYYGWLLYAFAGAAVLAGMAALVPRTIAARVWSGWVWLIPLGAIGASVYFMRIWFIETAG